MKGALEEMQKQLTRCDRTQRVRIERQCLKKNKAGEIVFKSIEDVQRFVGKTRLSPYRKERTTATIVSGTHGKPVFRISPMAEKGKYFVEDSREYTFDEQLMVFDLFNSMLCGVSELSGKKMPKKFTDDFTKVDKLLKQAGKGLPEDED